MQLPENTNGMKAAEIGRSPGYEGGMLERELQQQVVIASAEFNRMIEGSSNLNTPERLRLLNSLVLTGPSYRMLKVPGRELIPGLTSVPREITVLQSIPDIFVRSHADIPIGVEVDRLVSPVFEFVDIPAQRTEAFLQASTDARLAPFGRLINGLCAQLAFIQAEGWGPHAQRALAFAMWVIAERSLSNKAWRDVLCFRDPIARLTGLLALEKAAARNLVSRSMALDAVYTSRPT